MEHVLERHRADGRFRRLPECRDGVVEEQRGREHVALVAERWVRRPGRAVLDDPERQRLRTDGAVRLGRPGEDQGKDNQRGDAGHRAILPVVADGVQSVA